MRGSDGRSGALFSYVDLEDRVPGGHPLRLIRTIVNATLDALCRDLEGLYGRIGRPSIPPEKLLRALLLPVFSIRPERQLVERLDFDLLFRWCLGRGKRSSLPRSRRGERPTSVPGESPLAVGTAVAARRGRGYDRQRAGLDTNLHQGGR